MLHEPAPQEEQDDPASGFKAKLGVKMFIIYAIIYAGFVAIGLFSIETYEMEIIFGLNLAVVYGFGLIIFALALAIVYDRICASREESMKTPPAGGEKPDSPVPATEGGDK